jgi:hypothetical protein
MMVWTAERPHLSGLKHNTSAKPVCWSVEAHDINSHETPNALPNVQVKKLRGAKIRRLLSLGKGGVLPCLTLKHHKEDLTKLLTLKVEGQVVNPYL